MKIVAVSNQKGGVGKSTVAVHLAIALAEANHKVLFIDLDPQANATKTLEKWGCKVALNASALFDKEPSDFSQDQRITLIGADFKMADIERANTDVLATFKQKTESIDSFAYCIIDTPPTLGLRMTAALLVADFALAPIELEEYSIDGITKMLQTIFGIKNKWNRKLEFIGMLPNRFNPRSVAQKDTLKSLIGQYSQLLIQAHIGIRSSIPEALSQGVPVWDLKKTSAREAAKEYRECLDIIFEKIGAINE